MYRSMLKKYPVIELPAASFFKDDWFVGSALMGQDFKAFKKGIYAYNQETIWTKVLDLERLNPYWEIYNRTSNFLLVDQDDAFSFSFLVDFLEEIKTSFSKAFTFFFIASDPSLSEVLATYDAEFMLGRIPFFIDQSLVGSYLKVFVEQDGRFFPLLDCTVFDLNEKHYFEINCNHFYLELLDYFFHQKIPPKFKQFEQIFSINLSDSFLNFIGNQEHIRLVSLVDCLLQLSMHHVPISGNYRGHTTKKLLKRLALSAAILNLDLKKSYSVLSLDYCSFLDKELEKIQKTYPLLMKTYSKAILKDRYGLTDALYHYLSGDLLMARVSHDLKDVTYFTDLPFVPKRLSTKEFKGLVLNIIEGKKEKND